MGPHGPRSGGACRWSRIPRRPRADGRCRTDLQVSPTRVLADPRVPPTRVLAGRARRGFLPWLPPGYVPRDSYAVRASFGLPLPAANGMIGPGSGVRHARQTRWQGRSTPGGHMADRPEPHTNLPMHVSEEREPVLRNLRTRRMRGRDVTLGVGLAGDAGAPASVDVRTQLAPGGTREPAAPPGPTR